ncbi:Cyclin-related protein FAM58A [Trichinella britovi]|uniref:Cyclin-related protein FAM58A n=1 Tax=Trichinella britovi TaxID=45882 RepID=A0A0V1D2L9_TRIBR|nr:Cyclin-related protein FAM58A [Trichinella britovi]
MRQIYMFILKVGANLRLQCTTTGTAVLIFHSFIKKVSNIEQCCLETIGITCLHMAGWANEDLVQLRDCIMIGYRILHPAKELSERSGRYFKLWHSIARLERFILRKLRYNLQFAQPHKYLLNYLMNLSNWLERRVIDEQIVKMRISAVKILQDCYLKPELFDDNSSPTISIAAIYLALKICGICIPYADNDDPVPWWKVYRPSLTLERLIALCNDILEIYQDE